jgi:hypothetical protein
MRVSGSQLRCLRGLRQEIVDEIEANEEGEKGEEGRKQRMTNTSLSAPPASSNL